MNIRPRSIPKFQGGNNIWYLGLIDYDPTKYLISYDTSRLVNGDMSDNILSPWKSNISGYDVGRYLPTNHGAFGKDKEHYNYTLGVEGLDYYKKFGEDLLDSNGNFTPTGEAWARAVDALLPAGSNASFYDPKTRQLRTKWTTLYRDAHGRSAQTFTNLKDYVNHVRNDLLLGARHNVFLNKGKRYFYIDNLGQKHWVDPSVVDRYNVSKDPSELGWEGTTYWDDYELTGLKNPSKTPGTDPSETGGKIPVGQRNDPESLWSKIGANLNKIAPDLLDALRLAGNMHNNERVYRESMKAIIPNLLQSYHTYRQVVGDEATKLAYYRRAAQGQTQAARPFTSDADRQIAYQMEAKRVGDELRAQGDLADNQRIRETSAESAAHADANTERDTAVANSNLTELIKAKAAKHQLTALKYSADWTNLEQYLMGRLYKLEREKAKKENIEEQVKILQMLDDIANDPDIKAAYDSLNNKAKLLFPNGNVDWNDSRLSEDIKNLLSVRRKAMIKYYTLYAKEGTKIERKRKDDSLKYLYKTSRDVVEHFRKMSKMADDSRVRTIPKPIKLPSHPKKFQYGGVAPFTIYRPLGVGGESSYAQSTTSSSSGSGKSEKDTAAKDKLDMIKELFKSIKGLPVDVAKVYQDIMGTLNKAKAFGEELTTDDLASMYLSSMQKMALLKYSEDAYEKAKALATLNEALNEIAVGTSGEMVFLNLNTGEYKIGTIGSKMFKDKEWNPLTNDLILELRAKSPNMVFNDLMFNIVNNGVGLNKISAEIKSLAAGLSTTDRKIEGISEVQNNRVKAGLLILAGVQGTPDGYYKVTLNSKDSRANVDAALNYIYSVLPTNYKTILAIHSGSEENSKGLILKYLTSQANNVYEESISPLTGKASDKGSGSGDGDMLPSVAFFNGLGEKDSFIIQDKTNDGLKIDVVSTPITSKGYNTGSITFDKLESSDFGGQLLMNLATMGDSLISSTGRNNIIIDGRIYLTELPIDQEAKRTTGIIKPDLKFLKKIETADTKLRQMGIDKSDPKNVAIVNKVYLENNLPILYTISNNKPTITSEYARFAIVNGIGTEEAFGDNPEFNDGILEISSDKERQLFETMMQLLGNTKYKLDNGYGIGPLSWGETKLYKGTVYIPMVTSNISALAGTGFKAKGEEYNLIEARQQAADAARNKGFVPAGDASNFK